MYTKNQMIDFAEFIRTNYYGDGSPKLQPYELKYKSGTVRDIFEVWEKSITIYTDEVSRSSDLYSIKDWQRCIDNGYVTNDDGIGYWCKDGYASELDVFTDLKPEDANQVVWYNK